MFQCFISQLCCFDFMLTFLHCEFDALCHHFNKAFMYVCMYFKNISAICILGVTSDRQLNESYLS